MQSSPMVPTTPSVEYLERLPDELKELITSSSASHALNIDSVSSIIAALESLKESVGSERAEEERKAELLSVLAGANGSATQSYKQWSGSVTKFGKSVDKKFATPILPLFPPVPSAVAAATPLASTSLLPPPPPASFSSPEAIAALNEAIAMHLARIGAFTSLDAFVRESATVPIDPILLGALQHLHAILGELKRGDCTKALDWTASLAHEASDEIAFSLRKEEFVRILLRGSDLSSGRSQRDDDEDEMMQSISQLSRGGENVDCQDQVQKALAYGGTHFRSFMSVGRQPTISALLTAPLFMPFSRLLSSPYVSLFEEYRMDEHGNSLAQARLAAAFTTVFLTTLGVPRESPLSVVTDIGGSGALAKIQKVRMVMKAKRTEWSAIGELPVEIPLPKNHRYHSIFACPVSKEQGTATNPPMLLPCGHVIAKESLVRLARGSQTLKCPYCPVVSHPQAAVRIHF